MMLKKSGIQKISIIFSIASFIVVFNFFYSIVPPPIGVATTYITKFSPSTYIYAGDEYDMLIGKISEWDGYIVLEYWYHWPYDGPEKRDDWEPVVLLVSGGEVKAVASRAHYNWRVLYVFPVENEKPKVVFLKEWHTPLFLEYLPENYYKLSRGVVIRDPPEILDYGAIFGAYPDPTKSALASALIYGSIIAVVIYTLTRGFLTAISKAV